MAILKSLFFYMFASFGNALSIKAGIGVGSFLALNVVLAKLSQISVGTITALFNLFFLLLSFYLDKDRELKHYLLIVLALLGQGMVIDFFLRYVLSSITPNSYLEQLLLLIVGIVVTGIGLGRVLAYQKLEFPIEKCCQLLSEKVRFCTFASLRYGVDIVCVVSSVLLSLFNYQAVIVREGTLLSMIMLSGIITWAKSIKTLRR